MSRIPVPTLVTALFLVLVLTIYSVTFQVRFSEAAVKVRFGRASAESVIREPGLYWKLPPPIEFVRKYDTRLRVLETPETEIKTQDGQNIIVGCYAIWRIADPYLFSVRVPVEREAEEKLRTRINEVRATVVGRHKMADFVNLDRELVTASYEQIENEMLQQAAAGAARDYGIELTRVGVRRISLPEEATQTVLESMKQERERLATTYREEGRSLAATITASAEAAKNKILAFAERKAQEIEAAGVKASERIFEQIRPEDSDFFIWLRYLEALEAALKQKTTIFIDANTDIFRYFSQPAAMRELQPAAAPAPAAEPRREQP